VDEKKGNNSAIWGKCQDWQNPQIAVYKTKIRAVKFLFNEFENINKTLNDKLKSKLSFNNKRLQKTRRLNSK
jgi:hypothetical protein